jgi:AcrR family transcriptional regulator
VRSAGSTIEADAARGVTALDGTLKARIERAALTLFAESGVDAITTREIAAASGASEGALYRHYRGKEALAEALFFAIHHKLGRLIRDAGAAHDHIEAQARAIVAGYCQTADDDWPLFAYHLLTTHRFLVNPSPDRKQQDNPVQAAEDIVSAAMARRQLTEGDPAVIAAMALGVVLQLALHKAYGRIEGQLSDHQEALSISVIAVLRSS